VTGENLWTLTGFYKGWDPEMTTNQSVNFYPLARLFAVGINLEF
jgi:hypothetical protein